MQNGNPMMPEKKQLTITLSRDNVMNAVVGLQLVLLLVFGWQIIDIKQQLGGGSASAKVIARNTQPTPAGDTGAAAVADIVVTADEHMQGGDNAKVTIVEYSDFECPFCGRAYPTVNQVMETYGEDVRLVYRHFPLNSIHPQAQKAAEASECAADQGKFWEFHDKVFENQELLSGGATQLKKWAGELGLNASKFASCLDSGEKADIVQAGLDSGSAAGVTGTPAFFINGVALVGAQPFSSFQQVIDEQLSNS